MSHADLATLVAYWLGELDDAAEAALEEHYLGCAECGARLAEVEALAQGVRTVFTSGAMYAVVTPAFVERLHARGVHVLEYRVARNGGVNCSVGPAAEALFGRLEAPLEGVERIDMVIGAERFENVPFDASTGEVVIMPSLAHIRTLPAHVQVVRLVAVGTEGERVLGDYTFNHSPAGSET